MKYITTVTGGEIVTYNPLKNDFERKAPTELEQHILRNYVEARMSFINKELAKEAQKYSFIKSIVLSEVTSDMGLKFVTQTSSKSITAAQMSTVYSRAYCIMSIIKKYCISDSSLSEEPFATLQETTTGEEFNYYYVPWVLNKSKLKVELSF